MYFYLTLQMQILSHQHVDYLILKVIITCHLDSSHSNCSPAIHVPDVTVLKCASTKCYKVSQECVASQTSLLFSQFKNVSYHEDNLYNCINIKATYVSTQRSKNIFDIWRLFQEKKCCFILSYLYPKIYCMSRSVLKERETQDGWMITGVAGKRTFPRPCDMCT